MCDEEQVDIHRRHSHRKPLLGANWKIVTAHCNEVIDCVDVFARHPVVIRNPRLRESCPWPKGPPQAPRHSRIARKQQRDDPPWSHNPNPFAQNAMRLWKVLENMCSDQSIKLGISKRKLGRIFDTITDGTGTGPRRPQPISVSGIFKRLLAGIGDQVLVKLMPNEPKVHARSCSNLQHPRKRHLWTKRALAPSVAFAQEISRKPAVIVSLVVGLAPQRMVFVETGIRLHGKRLKRPDDGRSDADRCEIPAQMGEVGDRWIPQASGHSPVVESLSEGIGPQQSRNVHRIAPITSVDEPYKRAEPRKHGKLPDSHENISLSRA